MPMLGEQKECAKLNFWRTLLSFKENTVKIYISSVLVYLEKAISLLN
jgi:hypothetical protein